MSVINFQKVCYNLIINVTFEEGCGIQNLNILNKDVINIKGAICTSDVCINWVEDILSYWLTYWEQSILKVSLGEYLWIYIYGTH